MGYSDALGANCIELVPMELSFRKQQLITNMITNIEANDSCIQEMTPATRLLLDDLDSRLNGITTGDVDTNDNYKLVLEKIIDLQSDSSIGASIITALSNIYAVLNATEEVDAFEVACNTDNGIMAVDLSSYGFASSTDYSVLLSYEGTKPIQVSYSGKTESTFDIMLRDTRLWEFNPDADTVRDSSVDNVNISVAIIYKRDEISSTLKTARDADDDGVLDSVTIPTA